MKTTGDSLRPGLICNTQTVTVGYMYNKIFTKILDSSIWLENNATRIVWLTLLAAMDEDGLCQFASIKNLAHRARVSVEEAEEAARCLEGPDPDSSDPENGGRRLERIPGGWLVINAPKYREIVTRVVAKEKTRERVARHRAGNKPVTLSNGSVTPSGAVTDSATTARAVSTAKASTQKTLRNPAIVKAIMSRQPAPEADLSEYDHEE